MVCVVHGVKIQSAIRAFMTYTVLPSNITLFNQSAHLGRYRADSWIRINYVGYCLMGEQGAECIHARFNRLYTTISSTTDALVKLKYIMKEHLLRIFPTLITSKPPLDAREARPCEPMIIIPWHREHLHLKIRYCSHSLAYILFALIKMHIRVNSNILEIASSSGLVLRFGKKKKKN